MNKIGWSLAAGKVRMNEWMKYLPFQEIYKLCTHTSLLSEIQYIFQSKELRKNITHYVGGCQENILKWLSGLIPFGVPTEM